MVVVAVLFSLTYSWVKSMRFWRSMSSRYARMLLLMNRLSWSLIQSLKTNVRMPVVNSKKKMIPRNTENYSRKTENDAQLGCLQYTIVCKVEILSWNIQTWEETCFPGGLQCILQSPEWTWLPLPPWRARLGPDPPGLWWTRCWTEHPKWETEHKSTLWVSLRLQAVSRSGHGTDFKHDGTWENPEVSAGCHKSQRLTSIIIGF